jgi:anti-sigma B factor antagonist
METSFKFTEISFLCNQDSFLSVYGETMKPAHSANALQAARGQAGTGKSLTLRLDAQRPGGAIVLRCQGRLMSQNDVRTLAAFVTDVLPSARRMIVDLSGVESMDSDGLGELVLTHMWAEAAGFELKFAGPQKSVLKLFERTNLVSVFDLYRSVPEAMAAIGQEDVPQA